HHPRDGSPDGDQGNRGEIRASLRSDQNPVRVQVAQRAAGEPLATRLLVTGGAGFIGVNLIAELRRAADYDITVVDNESTGRFERIAESGNPGNPAENRDAEGL